MLEDAGTVALFAARGASLRHHGGVREIRVGARKVAGVGAKVAGDITMILTKAQFDIMMILRLISRGRTEVCGAVPGDPI